MTTAEARAKLHDLIESLPSADVPTALRILEALNADPAPLALRDIPIDEARDPLGQPPPRPLIQAALDPVPSAGAGIVGRAFAR